MLLTEGEILIVTSEKKGKVACPHFAQRSRCSRTYAAVLWFAAAALGVLNPAPAGFTFNIRIKNKADKFASDYDAIVKAVQASKSGVRA